MGQLEAIRYGSVELVLRKKAVEAEGRGDLETARLLERAADVVGQRVAKAAGSYTSVRRQMPAGTSRTTELERIVTEAKRQAHAPDIDREDVLSRLWTGSEGARVWALAVLEERPDFATTRAVLEAVQRPDHMFDQFHALNLANIFVRLPTTEYWEQKRIVDLVRQMKGSGAFDNDDECLEAAEALLSKDARPPIGREKKSQPSPHALGTCTAHRRAADEPGQRVVPVISRPTPLLSFASATECPVMRAAGPA